MKKVYYIIIIFIFCFLSVYAQNTTGNKFWLTFGQNASVAPTATSFRLQIRIVNGNTTPTTGIIYFTYLEDSITFSIGAHEVYTYNLDLEQKQAVYNTVMGVTDYSVYISSVKPVSVYAMNHTPGSLDATNILPVTALGTDYYGISYTNSSPIGFDAYAVVATQNGTYLYHNEDSVTTLNAGQVYYRTVTPPDITGSYINANHPVAFFAVNPLVGIPYVGGANSCLMQQLAPINTWSKSFFVPITHFTGDIVRIVASQDSTRITLTGGTVRYGIPGAQTDPGNMQAGDFVELQISDTGCYIVANKPVGVCSFLASLNLTISAPAQCWIPAIEQTIPYAQVAPFIPNGITQLSGHYALVVSPTDAKDSTKVSIEGAPPTVLTGGNWISNAAAEMSFYRMHLTNNTASYTFTNPEGLIVLCYAGGYSSSYYYLASSAMRDLDAAFYANNVHFQDLQDTTFCTGNVNFRAEIENMGVDMDSIEWYVNGVKENLPYNQLEWNETFYVGEHEIRMWVRFENEDTISKTGILKIKSCEVNTAFYANNIHHASLQDTIFCNKNVHFQAEIEGLHPEQGSIKWLINGEPQPELTDLPTWNREFETGTHIIDMEVVYENGETVTISGILRMEILWIKIRNIRTH